MALHGTSVLGAQCILLEGLLRPADWTYHQDPRRCQLPTFGAYALGLEVGRTNTYPHWAALDLLDRASKKGKGQLPVLIGALYRGKEAHLSLHAGGNDMAQLKLPGFGVATTSEKYTLAHSKHTGIYFFALIWGQLPPDTGSDSEDNVNYRRRGVSSSLPQGVPPGTNDDDDDGLPDVEGRDIN